MSQTSGREGEFRKRPVVVKAFQWFARDGAVGPVRVDPYREVGMRPWYVVDTKEGPLVVSDGDWIITGIKGEHYPCKPDIFALTYEPAATLARPADAAPTGGDPAGRDVHERR
jgi:hypothetical protein